jgi:hypothetical protein
LIGLGLEIGDFHFAVWVLPRITRIARIFDSRPCS